MCLFILLLPFLTFVVLVVVALAVALWPWLVGVVVVWLVWRLLFGSKKK